MDKPYGIALDYEPENMDPHAWDVGPERFPSFDEARDDAEKLSEGSTLAYLIVRLS